MHRLNILLDGLAKIFFPYKLPRKRPKSVARALRSDWLKIGRDFRKVLNSYG